MYTLYYEILQEKKENFHQLSYSYIKYNRTSLQRADDIIKVRIYRQKHIARNELIWNLRVFNYM